MQLPLSTGFRSVADTRLGDHLCLPIESDAERLAETAVFAEHALRRGGQVLVLCHTESPEEMIVHLTKRVPGARGALAANRLVVRSSDDLQLAGGTYVRQRVLDDFRDLRDHARHAGHRGLWVIADMAWILSGLPGAHIPPEHEALGNLAFLEGGAAGVCIYDVRKFPRKLMERFCSAHPVTLGQAALRFASRDGTRDLVLSGEADLTNRMAFTTVIDDLRHVEGHVRIDAGELNFADVHAVRVLADVERCRGFGATTITGSRRVNRIWELALRDEPGCGRWCGA